MGKKAAVELEQSILDYLRTGSWRSSAPCPVLSERGKTYVRHNAMRIGNAMDSLGGVMVAYLWDDMIVGWIRVPGTRLNSDRHQIQRTAEGRYQVSNPYCPEKLGLSHTRRAS